MNDLRRYMDMKDTVPADPPSAEALLRADVAAHRYDAYRASDVEALLGLLDAALASSPDAGLRAAVRDWIAFGAGDGTDDAEAENQRLLENIVLAYHREPALASPSAPAGLDVERVMDEHTPKVDGSGSGIQIGCSCGWTKDYGTGGWCPDFQAALRAASAPAGLDATAEAEALLHIIEGNQRYEDGWLRNVRTIAAFINGRRAASSPALAKQQEDRER